MELFEGHFDVKLVPREAPYAVLVDDTDSHFSASHRVLGLHVVRQQPRMMKLSRSAWKTWRDNPRLYDTYDASAGISCQGFRALARCVKYNHGDIQCIYLDWDKTLSVHSTFRADNVDKHCAECFFGGRERMKAMKALLDMCKSKRVPVAVFTCNQRARDVQGRAAFRQALRHVSRADVDVLFTDKCKVAQINRMVQ